ncbi:unnamed protein product [Rotaria magnacalcarata]|uniref:Uncharacterized protein n=1 Tax=Rotaria magnacalcarata TaxID=392030 RepID=A0A816SUL1_9BILA|nr:unnamed protein product [Rotaria magnacalcarata]CAF1971506.1 unnamed protein product [Rotaria magnacalcarata]CAF2089816.1 unnamed protein product [Rotaria magnacalcarata]CAF5044500.1 unnamed protein product [Rotaria magnacalcarata]
MDIKRNHPLSTSSNGNNPITSTPRNWSPLVFSSESKLNGIYTLNTTSLVNVHTSEKSGLLDEQCRIEYDIGYQASIKIHHSFIATYSS